MPDPPPIFEFSPDSSQISLLVVSSLTTRSQYLIRVSDGKDIPFAAFPIFDRVVSPDHLWQATAQDKRLVVTSGSQKLVYDQAVSPVKFSQNGRYLVGHSDRRVTVFDLAASTSGHLHALYELSFGLGTPSDLVVSNDGKELLMLSSEKSLWHWRLDRPSLRKSIPELTISGTRLLSMDAVGSAAVIAAGRRLVVYDVTTGRPAAELELAAQAGSCSLGCDTVTGDTEAGSFIWRRAQHVAPQLLAGYRQPRIADNADRILVNDNRGPVLLDRSGQVLAVLPDTSSLAAGLARFVCDDRFVTIASGETVYLFRSADGAMALRAPFPKVLDPGFECSPDNRRLVIADTDHAILLALDRMTTLATIPELVRGVAWATHSLYASGSPGRVFDTETGKQLSPVLVSDVDFQAVSPDGLHAVQVFGRTPAIVDLRSGATQALVGHTGRVQHARYSPDGSMIVTTSNDDTFAIWDAATASLIAVLWNPEPSELRSLAQPRFSGDGRQLIVSGQRGMATFSLDPAAWLGLACGILRPRPSWWSHVSSVCSSK